MPTTSDVTSMADAVSPTCEMRRIGDWAIECLLSEGNWSRVFRARPIDCAVDGHADYALKIAREDITETVWAAASLRREAQIGKTVSHPHVAAVLADYTHRQPAHFVMPYLHGTNLRHTIDRWKSLPTPHALRVTRQIAEAIGALHENNWLHRDIKPSNIHIAPDGHATLMDFGFAHAAGQPRAIHDRMLVGTLNYAAPETLCDLDEIGPPADVYSLGIVLFETMTGRLPFECRCASELATAHLQRRPPDPRQLAPRVSTGAVDLLRMMLAKEPDRRPTINQLVCSLANLELETVTKRKAA